MARLEVQRLRKSRETAERNFEKLNDESNRAVEEAREVSLSLHAAQIRQEEVRKLKSDLEAELKEAQRAELEASSRHKQTVGRHTFENSSPNFFQLIELSARRKAEVQRESLLEKSISTLTSNITACEQGIKADTIKLKGLKSEATKFASSMDLKIQSLESSLATENGI